MRLFMAVLLLATALSAAADCTSPWFPQRGNAVLVYHQTTTLLVRGMEVTKVEMEMRREHFAQGREIHFVETTRKDEAEPERKDETFRCTETGVVPTASGVKFRGAQYGSTLAPGAKWTFDWQAEGIGATYQYTVGEREKVKVPAGTFDSVRVDYRGLATSETRGKLPPITGTLWFADGIGLVKQLEDDPALGMMPDKSVMELVSISGR